MKGWIRVSSIGFLASYAIAAVLALAFPSHTSGLTQPFILEAYVTSLIYYWFYPPP